MLIKASALKGSSLKSLDGEIGSASDFYFDDRYWAVRYLVANTGNWLTGRMVLISPYSLRGVIKSGEHVAVQLTKKQIEDSPSIDTHEPVSRQYEHTYNSYYGFPNYWEGPYTWGNYPHLEQDRGKWVLNSTNPTRADRHLRSTQEVTGYHINALDGEIGHVEDFIFDDQTWIIRYLVVDTTNWLPGKKVLILPKWIENVSWADREVKIGLSRKAILAAPEYTDASLLTREYESMFYGHYNHDGYWVNEK